MAELKQNLFSQGPGGRHDWMRFHADDVPCPAKFEDMTCPGNLKWRDNQREALKCDTCQSIFAVKYVGRILKNKEKEKVNGN